MFIEKFGNITSKIFNWFFFLKKTKQLKSFANCCTFLLRVSSCLTTLTCTLLSSLLKSLTSQIQTWPSIRVVSKTSQLRYRFTLFGSELRHLNLEPPTSKNVELSILGNPKLIRLMDNGKSLVAVDGLLLSIYRIGFPNVRSLRDEHKLSSEFVPLWVRSSLALIYGRMLETRHAHGFASLVTWHCWHYMYKRHCSLELILKI